MQSLLFLTISLCFVLELFFKLFNIGNILLIGFNQLFISLNFLIKIIFKLIILSFVFFLIGEFFIHFNQNLFKFLILFSENFAFDFKLIDFGKFNCFFYLRILLSEILVLFFSLSDNLLKIAYHSILLIPTFAIGLINFKPTLTLIASLSSRVDGLGEFILFPFEYRDPSFKFNIFLHKLIKFLLEL